MKKNLLCGRYYRRRHRFVLSDYEYAERFLSSEYAHNYRMYAHGNSYKMITDPVNDRLFAGNPDGRHVHMFMIEGSETFIECMKKYLFEGKAWERWDVTPYFEFVKAKTTRLFRSSGLTTRLNNFSDFNRGLC